MISFAEKNFTRTHQRLVELMAEAPEVKTERWQGVVANTDTYELQDVNIEVPLKGIEDLNHWRQDAKPNLPWADDHFAERIGGEPLNPGEEWKRWRWGQSASKFTSGANERFNHSYMERLWPKYARRTPDGRLVRYHINHHLRKFPSTDPRPKFGIAYHYGDLEDLVDLLAEEPHTRQAYIPLFFPEDTGKSDGGRKVCTLGYQILIRDYQARIWYPLRSCDLIRHWADDCYMAVRLLLWIIDRCREKNYSFWSKVQPAFYSMHCTSLHIFASDKVALYEQAE